MEETLYDSRAICRFAGMDLRREPVPDETTGCKFRHLLETHTLGRHVFGFRKVRYWGLEDNADRLFVACGLVNMYTARRRLLRPA